MSTRQKDIQFTLFIVQRLSGALLAALMLVHLATVIYAVQGGLSVAEIVARVRGNGFWIAFYGVFAFAAVIHAAIGLRKILTEWTAVHRQVIDAVLALYVIGAVWLSVQAIEAIL